MMVRGGWAQYKFALRHGTWENVFLWKSEIIRAGVDQFAGICEIGWGLACVIARWRCLLLPLKRRRRKEFWRA
jgi:hypothetical protein